MDSWASRRRLAIRVSLARTGRKPNQFIWVLWLGALSLAVGVVTLGLGRITA
jgi:hypothetical protein